jgi:ATP phosphoribosyltransferase regulatory subunit
MRRMGRKDRAVGFAVFLNMLERLTEEADENA